jgi:hypothetical protein
VPSIVAAVEEAGPHPRVFPSQLPGQSNVTFGPEYPVIVVKNRTYLW